MSREAELERWIVILAGGIGSRFWPASTRKRPKQFLPLTSSRPLIAETIDRAEALAPSSNLLIVSGAHLRDPIVRHLPDYPEERLLLEPEPRGTAPALAWAAHEILARSRAPDRAVMVSLHSDHFIRPRERFVEILGTAIDVAARSDRLVTIGIRPSRPETGYGYIELGQPLDGAVGARRFVEKPDRETAEGYLATGSFVWNSGMFVWRPQVLLDELAAHTPELAPHLSRLDAGDVDGFFHAVPTLSIDRGLMERGERIAVVEADFEWDDVGAWPALLRVADTDAAGNVGMGAAHLLECGGCVIWAEDGPVVAVGLDDLLVARASGITFVAPLDRAPDLKAILAELPDELREGRG